MTRRVQQTMTGQAAVPKGSAAEPVTPKAPTRTCEPQPRPVTLSSTQAMGGTL